MLRKIASAAVGNDYLSDDEEDIYDRYGQKGSLFVSSAKVYGIYIARFPFLDSNNDKVRPVMVVSKPFFAANIFGLIERS